MTEREYVDLYYRDLELNLVAFKRVLDCEPHIRALAQIAYDMGFSAAKCGDTRTTLDDWDKMPARYIQLADANVLRSKPGRKHGEDE
jgi:hypothetical protein